MFFYNCHSLLSSSQPVTACFDSSQLFTTHFSLPWFITAYHNLSQSATFYCRSCNRLPVAYSNI